MNILNKLKNLYNNITPYTYSRTYLLIIIIPLVFNICCYSYSKCSIEEVNSAFTEDTLNASRTFLDSSLESIAYCATQLSLG